MELTEKRICLEHAQPDDARELLRIQTTAFAVDLEKYGSGPSGFDSLEWQIDMIESGNYYKIILDGEKIIGGMVVFDKGEDYLHLTRIFIDPDYQNMGLGQLAVCMVERDYPEARRWTLDTPYLNLRNHYFYEKLGYLKVGETEPDPETGFYLFLFEKKCENPSME